MSQEPQCTTASLRRRQINYRHSRKKYLRIKRFTRFVQHADFLVAKLHQIAIRRRPLMDHRLLSPCFGFVAAREHRQIATCFRIARTAVNKQIVFVALIFCRTESVNSAR